MGCCGLGRMPAKCFAASPKVAWAVVKVWELQRFEAYGSTTGFEYPGTFGCCVQPHIYIRMQSSAGIRACRDRLRRTNLSLGRVFTVPALIRSGCLSILFRPYYFFFIWAKGREPRLSPGASHGFPTLRAETYHTSFSVATTARPATVVL